MLKYSLTILLVLFQAIHAFTFCGFYVAKADAKLFNKSSQVIIARDGKQVAITMSSDFEGDVKDFAMVVPVAEVITRNQIRIADQKIFDKLDAYSGPRLVEYHDHNPCEPVVLLESVTTAAPRRKFSRKNASSGREKKDLGVKILESYTVGEYDILILSAEESDGLETWLIKNGYKIPQKASAILKPYIKSDMKFFVVKVNMKNFKRQGFDKLRPIQMTFRSDKFMLPIRLGMANAQGDQDLIIYSFSKRGRIETTNYQTLEIPTDKHVPLGIKKRFGEFYKALYDKAWADAGKKAVHVEYAWNLSSSNFVKCDPCPTQPPIYSDLREAGVFWLTSTNIGRRRGSNYQGDVFMTRLHVRYNRNTFPQDLMFQETPNKQNFQGRYIMTHPAKGDLTCSQGQNYLRQLHARRFKEVQNLAALTDWSTSEYQRYIQEYDSKIKDGKDPYLQPMPDDKGKGGIIPINPTTPLSPLPWFLTGLILLLLVNFAWYFKRKFAQTSVN